MNTTTIIRQIKEYMGAYGKAYTLLYLIGAVTILTSCVKDDLYDTPHPDRGAVVVTTDWSGKSTEADIPQAYTLRIGGREQNVSAATNVFDALLAPGGYGLTVYNSPEGISIDGNKATVNPVDLTGAIEPHPGYLFASHQDISVVSDWMLRQCTGAPKTATDKCVATFDAATGVMTFTMILLPQTLANALVLEISPDDGEYQSYSNKDMIKPALEAGYSYTYTITVKKTGLTLSGSTIENWNDGGSHAGDAKM